MRRDTLNERIAKLNMRSEGYREHLLIVTFERMGEKATERELLADPPESVYGPASSYDRRAHQHLRSDASRRGPSATARAIAMLPTDHRQRLAHAGFQRG
jgi:hypothetical protein